MFSSTGSSVEAEKTHYMQENRFMHLASLEQQRELMRYMNSLNDWLGHDVEDRQAELRGVSARIDQLHEDMNRLGVPRGQICKVTVHYRYSTALIDLRPAATTWTGAGRFHGTWCPAPSCTAGNGTSDW